MNQYLYTCTFTWCGPQPVINICTQSYCLRINKWSAPQGTRMNGKMRPLQTSQQDPVLFLHSPLCDYSLCFTKSFLAKFGCTVSVSKTIVSPNSNCLLLTI